VEVSIGAGIVGFSTTDSEEFIDTNVNDNASNAANPNPVNTLTFIIMNLYN
jgi:hypothetical protein